MRRSYESAFGPGRGPARREGLSATQENAALLASGNSTSAQPEPGSLIVLPDLPIVSIRPSGRWVPVNFKEIWAFRELLYFLAWRDVKVRYKQTALGILWVLLQPLLTTLVFTFLFGRLAGVPSEGVPYALFAYVGLVPWTFFSNASTNSSNSLLGSNNLITKVYFPRLIIPAAPVVAALLDLVIALGMAFVLLAAYHVTPTWRLLFLPVLMIIMSLLVLGVGAWLSALNVRYRDLRHALPFLIQLGIFVTPVIYSPELIPPRWRTLLWANPLAALVDGYRGCLLGRPLNWAPLAGATLLTAIILISGALVFRRTERIMADII